MRGTASSAESGSLRRQDQRVLGGSRQKRQRRAKRPLREAGAVIRRQRVPALPARQVQVTLLLVAGRDGEALGGAEAHAVLHARHIVVARQFQGWHVEKGGEPRQGARQRMT